jgi:hypothetical protein
LYDGVVTDDDINNVLQYIPNKTTVIIVFDSCHSGTSTRSLSYKKGRFQPLVGEVPKASPKKKLGQSNPDMKWIAFSGCQSDQVSYDAFINGKFRGAFSYYFLKNLQYGITYQELIEKIRKELPNSSYDQIPMLEGNANIMSRIVFR